MFFEESRPKGTPSPLPLHSTFTGSRLQSTDGVFQMTARSLQAGLVGSNGLRIPESVGIVASTIFIFSIRTGTAWRWCITHTVSALPLPVEKFLFRVRHYAGEVPLSTPLINISLTQYAHSATIFLCGAKKMWLQS